MSWSKEAQVGWRMLQLIIFIVCCGAMLASTVIVFQDREGHTVDQGAFTIVTLGGGANFDDSQPQSEREADASQEGQWNIQSQPDPEEEQEDNLLALVGPMDDASDDEEEAAEPPGQILKIL